MFGKGFHAQAQQAFMGMKNRATRMYATGRQFASKFDAGYQTYKRLHTALSPTLKDFGLKDVVQHSKRAIDTYDKVRAHALGAHESAERFVGHAKRVIPELGL